jgi:hypothetical protein
MFQGADVVFRRVLVPLTGQYENLLLRDTLMVRREMEKNIHPKSVKAARERAAALFLKEESSETAKTK